MEPTYIPNNQTQQPPVQTAPPVYPSSGQAPAVMPGNSNPAFFPNKILLATVIGIIALFTSALGLIPALIAMQMAKELPLDYSPADVKRARAISTAAFVINLIEVIAGVLVTFIIFIANA